MADKNKSGLLLPNVQNGLRNQYTILYGCDSGNGATKGYGLFLRDNRYHVFRVSIPSLVTPGTLVDANFCNNEELIQGLVEVVDSNGQSFITAQDVCNGLDMDSLPTGSTTYQSSSARGALVHASIIKALKESGIENVTDKEFQVYMGCTMMAGLYWEGNGLNKNTVNISEVAASLGAPYRTAYSGPIVTTRRTEMFAETLAASLSVLLDANGDKSALYDNGSTLAFIDVGHTDTVVITLKVVNGLPKLISRKSYAIGIDKIVISPIANKLSNLTTSIVGDGLYLLYDKGHRHRGRTIDLTPLKQDAVRSLSSQVLGIITKAINGGNSYEATYLVGGFPQLATELFGEGYFAQGGWESIYNLIIPENPAFVNAQGALFGLMARLREPEKVTR